MSKFSVGSSKRVVDLRKKKAGAMRTLPLSWNSRSKREKPARRSSLRERRRRTRTLMVLSVFTLLAAVLYGVSWASYLPQFSVGSITVAGTKELRSEIVLAYAETVFFDGTYAFLSPQNIFFYPRERLERAIREHFPRTRSVQVSRESLLAQAVIVTVEEREPFARWCRSVYTEEGDSAECYLLDETGFIFAPAATSSNSDTQYVFRGSLPESGPPLGQGFLSEKFPEIVVFLRELERNDFSPVGISEDAQDLFLMLARGFELRVSLETLEKSVRNLQLVLSSDALRGRESELEYVDLRFGNRVYYKFKGGEQQVQ